MIHRPYITSVVFVRSPMPRQLVNGMHRVITTGTPEDSSCSATIWASSSDSVRLTIHSQTSSSWVGVFQCIHPRQYAFTKGKSADRAITQVVDRIGAGDSVFAVASLLAAQKAPMEVVGFVGNAAGAQAVATVGHRDSLERLSLIRHMETLLK